jgi:hypothetical protein
LFGRCPRGGGHDWTSWTIYMAVGTGSNVSEMVRHCRKCGKSERKFEKRKGDTWKGPSFKR